MNDIASAISTLDNWANTGHATVAKENMLNCMASVAGILRTMREPLTIQELISRVEQTGSANPVYTKEAVNRAIGRLYQVVSVAPGRYGWLSNLLDGTVVRHPLTAEEAQRGFLHLDELEHALFFPQFFQSQRQGNRKLEVTLFGGPTLITDAYIERKTWALRLGSEFCEWIDMQGGQGRDDILIVTNDANAGKYTIRLQPREIRNDDEIQERNMHLTLVAEEIVRERQADNYSILAAELAAELVGRGVYADRTPPDDLHFVLHQGSLLQFNDGYYRLVPTDRRVTNNAADLLEDDSSNLPMMDSPYNTPAIQIDANDEWEPLLDANYLPNELIDPMQDAMMDDGIEQEILPFNEPVSLDVHADYDTYLDRLYLSDLAQTPLSLDEFQLLKAELEALIYLEYEFGYLLTEQQECKQSLISSLHIGSSSIQDDDDAPDRRGY